MVVGTEHISLINKIYFLECELKQQGKLVTRVLPL